MNAPKYAVLQEEANQRQALAERQAVVRLQTNRLAEIARDHHRRFGYSAYPYVVGYLLSVLGHRDATVSDLVEAIDVVEVELAKVGEPQ